MSTVTRLIKPCLKPEAAQEITDLSWLATGDVYTLSIQGSGGRGICFGGRLAVDFAELISRSAKLAVGGNGMMGVPEIG